MSSWLRVRVIPRARRMRWAGRRGEAWVVPLQAPPVQGAANEALLRFLAKELGVRRSDLAIVSGEHARDKVVRMAGATQEELEARVARLVKQRPR